MTYDGPDTTITEVGPCTLIQELEPQAVSQPIAVCDSTVSATGAQAASWTRGVNSDGPAAVATFKAAVAPPAGTRRGGPFVFP